MCEEIIIANQWGIYLILLNGLECPEIPPGFGKTSFFSRERRIRGVGGLFAN